ncbi:peptide-N4-asparagine amidase [Actinokineospora sp. HUAS TT18]|uniref:peptide-N4-asparagine amidase n=1 Tax=Actinokineospora sp. HUAS TT18 TaxID=3447451 RepID=UPI003F525255
MKRFVLGAVAALLALSATTAHATPPEFGTDWDDPRTAAPAITTPPTKACTVDLVNYQFRDFTPFTGTYTPPADCAGPWNKVILRMDTSIAGRQYDRLGALRVGDVTIFKTSTAEPSPDGIRWQVEKDISAYAPVLRTPQPVWMLIGNVVNDTYTGILDTRVTLTFYQTGPGHGPADAADDVIALANPTQTDGALHGKVTIPANTERLIAEVHATGSGGGCEEFWYGTTPSATGYSCGTAENGPYREVQVLIDGQLAGIAAPYPHIYTGGWSNPFLWYVIPAPRAFDIQPLRYDLTPFLGALTDGAAHNVTVRTIGVPAGQAGWDTPINFQAWRDHGSTRVTGGLLAAKLGELTNTVRSYEDGAGKHVDVVAAHRFTAVGYVQTSHGRVVTTVTRELANDNKHHWGADENPDTQHAWWTDKSTVAVSGVGVTTSTKKYTMDGTISIGAGDRLRTDLALGDYSDDLSAGVAGVHRRSLADTFSGDATWTLGVPRPDRHAVGQSTQRYKVTGTDGCYDRTLKQINGWFVGDTLGC